MRPVFNMVTVFSLPMLVYATGWKIGAYDWKIWPVSFGYTAGLQVA